MYINIMDPCISYVNYVNQKEQNKNNSNKIMGVEAHVRLDKLGGRMS